MLEPKDVLVTADSLIREFGEAEAYTRGVGVAVVATRLGDTGYARQVSLALQEMIRRGLHKEHAKEC